MVYAVYIAEEGRINLLQIGQTDQISSIFEANVLEFQRHMQIE